jgi:hypothetical protein
MGKYVSIDQIKPGMTLAAPVVNRYGQIVIATGIELQLHHIERLKTWGVSQVSIQSESENGSGFNQHILDLAKEQIDAQLTWTPRNQAEIDIYNAAVELAILNILNSSGGGS